MYTETIVCFAHSRKFSGRCVAGKRYRDGVFGEWIRPVSAKPTEELTDRERRFSSGEYPELLDVIVVPLSQKLPMGCQTENHMIDARDRWKKVGRVAWADLDRAVDVDAETLWKNGYDSSGGKNDRIPAAVADMLKSSLMLIKPENVRLSVSQEGIGFLDPRPRVRATFTYRGQQYRIRVTDPIIEKMCTKAQGGECSVSDAYMCVSLGEPYQGYRYKLAASIIMPS